MLSRIPRRLLSITNTNIKLTNRLYLTPLISAQPSRFPLRLSSSTSTPMAAQTDTHPRTHTPESLTSTLQSKISTTHVQIQDMSGGCGQAFTAIIVSDEFKGKSALQRHRLVNGALKEEIAAIHAWTPRCLTVEQWEKEKE